MTWCKPEDLVSFLNIILDKATNETGNYQYFLYFEGAFSIDSLKIKTTLGTK